MMTFNPFRISGHDRLLAVLAVAAGVLAPAGNLLSAQAPLELRAVTFEPPFVEVGRRQQVRVTISVANALPGVETLELDELIPLGGSEEEANRVGTLRARRAGDSVFVGAIRLASPVCGVQRLRVTQSDGSGTTAVGPILELPSAARYFAVGELLSTRIVEEGSDEVFEFSAARGGDAFLTIEGAAQAHASDDAKVDVFLDDELLLTVPPGTDCTEILIPIADSGSEIEILTEGSSERGVAVRVDALADRMTLRTMQEPSGQDDRPLRVEAQVEALGLPVANAEVRFTLDRGRSRTQSTTISDDAGRAQASFAAADVGSGATLHAEVLNARLPLQDSLAVALEDRALLSLGQPEQQLTIEAGQSASLDLALRAQAQGAYRISLDQSVSPADGLELESILPAGGLAARRPGTFVVRQVFAANSPGTYEVLSRATLAPGNAVAEGVLTVEVVPAGAQGRLVVYRPVAEPALLGVSDSDSDPDATVVFKVAVAGVGNPPEEVVIEQMSVDSAGNIAPQGESIATLFDEGDPPDEVAGDLIYSGSTTIGSSSEVRNVYRASASAGDATVNSSLYVLEIAGFPSSLVPGGDSPETQFAVLEDPVTGEQFAADQLLVTFPDTVPPERIRSILGSEDVEIMGFEPTLNVFQVTGPTDGTAESLRRLAANLRTYAEVESVDFNHRLQLAAYPNDVGYVQQQSLERVRAVEGWLGARPLAAPGHARHIAILDTGVDFAHSDLAGNRLAGENCILPGQPPRDQGGHGTTVAGVAAARSHNDVAIAGAGVDARYVPVRVYSLSSFVSDLLCGLSYVRGNLDRARIANISLFAETPEGQLRTGINDTLRARGAADALEGILIVAAAGNGRGLTNSFTDKAYPAGYNDVIGGRNGDVENGLIAVANSNAQDRPFDGQTGTRRGPWVDLAAPGVNVLSLKNNSGTETIAGTGTSLSAPLVAGAAAVLWSRNPTLTIGQVEALVKQSAVPFTGAANVIGTGRLDFAEVMLNGSMEITATDPNSPAYWAGACTYQRPPRGSGSAFFQARDRRQFLLCQGGNQTFAEKTIRVPAGAGRLRVTLKAAGIVFGGTGSVQLRLTLTRPGVAPIESAQTFPAGNCRGGVALPQAPAGPKCSQWVDLSGVIPARTGPWTLRIRARPVGGAGPVFLLLDQVMIGRAP